MIARLLREEEGQGLTEYALIVVFVSIVVIGILIVFRNSLVNDVAKPASNAMQNAIEQ